MAGRWDEYGYGDGAPRGIGAPNPFAQARADEAARAWQEDAMRRQIEEQRMRMEAEERARQLDAGGYFDDGGNWATEAGLSRTAQSDVGGFEPSFGRVPLSPQRQRQAGPAAGAAHRLGPVPQRVDKTILPRMEALQADQVGVSRDGYQTINDPALKGVNAQIRAMIEAGASAAAVRAYAKSVGLGPNLRNLDAAVSYRRRNGRYGGRVDVDDKTVPVKGVRKVIGKISASPVGAYGIGALDALSFGTVDNIAGMAGGDAAQTRAKMRALAADHSNATAGGQIVGGTLAAMLGEAALARAGVAGGTNLFAQRALASDGLYGGLYGAGSNDDDRLNGALRGSLVGLLAGRVGNVGRQGVRAGALGLGDASAGYLARMGIAMPARPSWLPAGRINGFGEAAADRTTSYLTGSEILNGLRVAREQEAARGLSAGLLDAPAASTAASFAGAPLANRYRNPPTAARAEPQSSKAVAPKRTPAAPIDARKRLRPPIDPKTGKPFRFTPAPPYPGAPPPPIDPATGEPYIFTPAPYRETSRPRPTQPPSTDVERFFRWLQGFPE